MFIKFFWIYLYFTFSQHYEVISCMKKLQIEFCNPGNFQLLFKKYLQSVITNILWKELKNVNIHLLKQTRCVSTSQKSK